MNNVVTHNLDDLIARLQKKAEDYSVPLNSFYGYMLRRTQLTFSRLGRRGNTTRFREMLWDWFAPQYTRKDGTVVPAEGGIPKVRGDGVVKGRLRHSGTRVTARSMLMQDRGQLKASALASYRVGKSRAVFRTPPRYADEQQRMRKFAFVTTEDVNMLRQLIVRHLVSDS